MDALLPIIDNPELSDELWARIRVILPLGRRKIKKGRPRMSDRKAMAAILFKLSSNCSWKALPIEMGSGSTIYDRYQEWSTAGVFEKMVRDGMLNFKEKADQE